MHEQQVRLSLFRRLIQKRILEASACGRCPRLKCGSHDWQGLLDVKALALYTEEFGCPGFCQSIKRLLWIQLSYVKTVFSRSQLDIANRLNELPA